MLLRNDTPFAAIGFGHLHRDGMSMAVIAVRASYLIGADGALTLANEQEMLLRDIYEGDPHRTPLLRVGDLIPYKPRADVTVLGNAYAPRGKPAECWIDSVTVGTHKAKLLVHGPRQWEPSLKFLTPTWKLGPATPVTTVPLDYRLASGGYWVGDGEGRFDERNKIGPGILRRNASQVGHPLRAPQIEALDESIGDPFAAPTPRGFGPIPPFWAFREQQLGTRDEAWQRERCPRAPKDFSFRFCQTAHPDLIVPALNGDEVVSLRGLLPEIDCLAFRLPNHILVAHHEWFDGRETSALLTLDGLHLDLRRPDGPWRADLTWRGWVARCPDYHGAKLSLAGSKTTADLAGQGEFGLASETVLS